MYSMNLKIDNVIFRLILDHKNDHRRIRKNLKYQKNFKEYLLQSKKS